MREAFATVQQTFNNPGGRVLRYLVGLATNVDDEVIYANVAANAKKYPANWVNQEPAHDGVAVLCGSGPSLADNVETIRGLQASGAKVFALNGAAYFLWHQHKIMPDFQVILDAKPETATLVGPAKDHLFASQVDPECFKKRPHAQLWHSTHGTWVPEFEPPFDYTVIQGSATVGNTATVLVYALGYRKLHLFGYDSSHRDTSGHAFSQPMNADDQTMVTEFRGKKYVSSFVMALQAKVFIDRARQLELEGCEIAVHGDGLLPDKWRAFKTPMNEREKYEAVWQTDTYRVDAPGVRGVEVFLPLEDGRGRILDIGCGTGKASLKLQAAGFEPVLVDFADNCRDTEAQSLEFHRLDIVRDELPKAPFGFCADVMEHLPTEDVPSAIENILKACGKVFFQIRTTPDEMGDRLIGKPLHLTVKPLDWWRAKLVESGAVVLFEEDAAETVYFYVARPA